MGFDQLAGSGPQSPQEMAPVEDMSASLRLQTKLSSIIAIEQANEDIKYQTVNKTTKRVPASADFNVKKDFQNRVVQSCPNVKEIAICINS